MHIQGLVWARSDAGGAGLCSAAVPAAAVRTELESIEYANHRGTSHLFSQGS